MDETLQVFFSEFPIGHIGEFIKSQIVGLLSLFGLLVMLLDSIESLLVYVVPVGILIGIILLSMGLGPALKLILRLLVDGVDDGVAHNHGGDGSNYFVVHVPLFERDYNRNIRY